MPTYTGTAEVSLSYPVDASCYMLHQDNKGNPSNLLSIDVESFVEMFGYYDRTLAGIDAAGISASIISGTRTLGFGLECPEVNSWIRHRQFLQQTVQPRTDPIGPITILLPEQSISNGLLVQEDSYADCSGYGEVSSYIEAIGLCGAIHVENLGTHVGPNISRLDAIVDAVSLLPATYSPRTEFLAVSELMVTALASAGMGIQTGEYADIFAEETLVSSSTHIFAHGYGGQIGESRVLNALMVNSAETYTVIFSNADIEYGLDYTATPQVVATGGSDLEKQLSLNVLASSSVSAEEAAEKTFGVSHTASSYRSVYGTAVITSGIQREIYMETVLEQQRLKILPTSSLSSLVMFYASDTDPIVLGSGVTASSFVDVVSEPTTVVAPEVAITKFALFADDLEASNGITVVTGEYKKTDSVGEPRLSLSVGKATSEKKITISPIGINNALLYSAYSYVEFNPNDIFASANLVLGIEVEAISNSFYASTNGATASSGITAKAVSEVRPYTDRISTWLVPEPLDIYFETDEIDE